MFFGVPAGGGWPNGRIGLEVPRDRAGSFDPHLIAKSQRRFPGFDEKIISMYARGMSGPHPEAPSAKRWASKDLPDRR